MDCENCIYKSRIEALEKDMERNSSQHREFYNNFKNLDVQNAVTNEKFTTLIGKLDSLCAKMDVITSEPKNKWNSVVDTGIKTVVGAVVGAIAALILK